MPRRLAVLLSGLAVLLVAAAVWSGRDFLTLLIVPFGVVALLLVRSTELALLAVVLAVPIDTNLELPVAGGVSVSKLLATLLMAALSYDVCVRGRRLRLFDDSLDYVVVGLAVLVLLSCVCGRYAELGPVLRLVRMVGFYFCIKNLVRSGDVLKRVLWALALSGGATALYSIVSFAQARIDQGIEIRVSGVAMHPNDYATLMLVVVVIAFHLVFQSQPRRWERALAASIAAVGTYAVVLTGSRAGIVNLAIALAVAIFRQPARWRILPVVMAMSLLSWALWPRTLSERMTATFENASSSEEAMAARSSMKRRATYIPFALDLIAERPLIGHGYHAFRQLYASSEYARAANELEVVERERVAHNTYLEIAVGSGVPAAMVFVSMFWVAHRQLRRAVRGNGDLADIAAGALEVVLIGLALSMLFKSIPAFKAIWLVLGLASAVCALRRRESAQLHGIRVYR